MEGNELDARHMRALNGVQDIRQANASLRNTACASKDSDSRHTENLRRRKLVSPLGTDYERVGWTYH